MTEDEQIYAKAIGSVAGYAEVLLNIRLHPIHRQTLEALFHKKKSKVILRAANGSGKTSTVITVAILYALQMLNATVVSTAGNYRQITGQLMPSLKRFSHLYPQWKFNENGISINNNMKYIGFSTDSEGHFQGWHERDGQPLLMIVDEAATVREEIYKAIDRCQPTYLLICGSPLSPEGMFYNIEAKPELARFFNHYKLTAFDCPWIDKEEVEVVIAKWGKDHILTLSSIYADFSTETENAIISLSAIEDCLNHPPEEDINALSERHVGLDFAAGGDETVLALRHGNKVSIQHCSREKDTMTSAGLILRELNRLKTEIGLKASEVSGDAGGLGLPICHRLRELGWPIQLFYGQAKPHDENYKNIIAEIWLEGAKQIQNKKIILPNDYDLKCQILGRKQRWNSSGKLELEHKDDMKERGLDSPDRADAVFLAMATPAAGTVRSIIPGRISHGSLRFS